MRSQAGIEAEKSACVLCGAECESVVHVLWECSAYSNLCGEAFTDMQILTSLII